MTTIYILPITSSWDHQDELLLNIISKERQAKISNYNAPSQRKHSLYASLLTRMALTIHFDLNPNQLSFAIGKHQKPYLSTDPACHFNYSHTNGMILCAVNNASIGVDVELIKPAPFKVMNKTFHSLEIDYVQATTDPLVKSQRFFEIWTRKEAYFKYLGDGLTHNLTTLNTLENKYTQHFHTWSDCDYQMAVYSPNLSTLSIEYINELNLKNYFL